MPDTVDEILAAELTSRGWTCTPPAEPIRRVELEQLDEATDTWTGTGAFVTTAEPVDPDSQLAQWMNAETLPGVYRAVIYEGAEPVGASAPRVLV
jgi:hypothetical protein